MPLTLAQFQDFVDLKLPPLDAGVNDGGPYEFYGADQLFLYALNLNNHVALLTNSVAKAWMGLQIDALEIVNAIGDASFFATALASSVDATLDELMLEPGDASEACNELAAAVLGRNAVAITMIAVKLSNDVVELLSGAFTKSMDIESVRLSASEPEFDAELLVKRLSLLLTTLSLVASAHGIPYEDFVLQEVIERQRADETPEEVQAA